jgi:hypothetical protein
MLLPQSDASQPSDLDGLRSENSTIRSLRPLWIVVSGIWIAATLLRIKRVWVPRIGWHETLASPVLWTSLILPTSMTALIIGAISRRANAQR